MLEPSASVDINNIHKTQTINTLYVQFST